jgi:hypothetical protein
MVVNWVTQERPDSLQNVALLLLFLFFAATLTLSIMLYFFFYRQAQKYTNLRMVYRRGLKWSIYISLGLVFILGMRALDVYNLLNLGLFIILYYAIYLQIRTKR